LTPVPQLTATTLVSDFTINAIGPIVLFNAFSSLLQAANKTSPGSAKFVAISTAAAMIANPIPYPVNSYGASKAALNFLLKKIDVEYADIVTFPIQ
jgi:norsolorinic acid ketoreductase